MPSTDQLAKAISIGLVCGLFCSILGMSISYASTATSQMPQSHSEQVAYLHKSGDTK